MTLRLPLHSTLIIAAHPDDEILWFSSILTRVTKIVLCFLPLASQPRLSQGRTQLLSHYPLNNVQCLGIAEASVFSSANFARPRCTFYGVEIVDRSHNRQHYIDNYFTLIEELRLVLPGYDNVFTHNPWGEYGNEEHIQVYKAVRYCQKEFHFDLWFGNYCSNRSFELMLMYLLDRYSGHCSLSAAATLRGLLGLFFKYAIHMRRLRADRLTMNTNVALAEQIADLYKKYDCWTWVGDWRWFKRESFVKDDGREGVSAEQPIIFIPNLINMRSRFHSSRRERLYELFRSGLGRNVGAT